MFRAYLPKALALTLLSAGLGIAGAQQLQDPQPAPDANAPQHHHHAPNPQRQADMLTKKLGLTPDQSAKIEPILADRDQKMQALMANTQLAPEDRHQQMKAINQDSQGQMAAVLTPDQIAQLKEMRHHGHGHHGPDNQPNENGQSPS